MSMKNLQIRLASRPSGEPTLDNFERIESEIPVPQPGQMLLRAIYLSLDPYMRGRMNAGKSYVPPLEIGEVMEGRTVSQVVSSNLPDYQPGDFVFNPAHGWQEYALSSGEGCYKMDSTAGPLSYALSVLGMPGMTAYTGLENAPRELIGLLRGENFGKKVIRVSQDPAQRS